MNMNSLLESLYQNDINAERLEKTAEAKMLNNLATGTNNPYEDWTVEELIKAAQEIEALENGEQALYEIEEETEKVAFDMLGGQVMAHAMVHEMDLMKVAMMNGLCRVCKENEMDVTDSTVCSTCLGE